jgi:glycine/D-amino acid oxidase-like deaminating enzyme
VHHWPVPDVTVIGAGIVGCAAAWMLAERGATVTVLEREHVAAAASGRNAGSIQRPLVIAYLQRVTDESD